MSDRTEPVRYGADECPRRAADPNRPPHDPTVACALAGFLAIASLVAWRERAADERALVTLAPPARDPAADVLDLGRWSARELRALPGLGERRAVAIVRARAAGAITGDVEELDALRGIGPETVRAIRAELERPAPRRASATVGAEHADTNVTP